MTIGADIVRKWIERLRAALLDLESNESPADRCVTLARESWSGRGAPFICLYSDAEFQVLLRELHYPTILH